MRGPSRLTVCCDMGNPTLWRGRFEAGWHDEESSPARSTSPVVSAVQWKMGKFEGSGMRRVEDSKNAAEGRRLTSHQPSIRFRGTEGGREPKHEPEKGATAHSIVERGQPSANIKTEWTNVNSRLQAIASDLEHTPPRPINSCRATIISRSCLYRSTILRSSCMMSWIPPARPSA